MFIFFHLFILILLSVLRPLQQIKIAAGAEVVTAPPKEEELRSSRGRLLRRLRREEGAGENGGFDDYGYEDDG